MPAAHRLWRVAENLNRQNPKIQTPRTGEDLLLNSRLCRIVGQDSWLRCVPHIKQCGHGKHAVDVITCMPEMLADAEPVFDRTQERIMIERRQLCQTARTMTGDHDGRNPAATRIIGISGIAAAARGMTTSMLGVVLVEGDHDRAVLRLRPE